MRPALTVLCWNMGNGLAPPDRLEARLRQSGADVIGLVEVATAQAPALKALADVYPYRAVFGEGIPGKAVLSRWPIHEARALPFHPKRPDVYAELEWQGAPLHVVVVHPPPPVPWAWTARRRQIAQIRALAEQAHPLVLMGDFNMITAQPGWLAMRRAGLHDAWASAGPGRARTFPLRRGQIPLFPLMRLDYIFHSTELHAVSARVGKDAGSDHLPVLAVLERV